MSEKFKGFRGFVNPILRGKRTEAQGDNTDTPTTEQEEINVDTPADEVVQVPENTEEERERMPDPETVREFFEKFDEEYRKLQKSVTNEISDCRQMYRYEKHQADKLRDMVSARDVLEELLPFLTEMKTEIDGLTDIDEFKLLFSYRYRALVKRLDKKGVKLLTHDRGQKVELTSTVRVTVRPTDDISLDDTAGELEQIGCIIKGEEDNPIIEKVQLYQFDESLVKKETDVQNDTEQEPIADTENTVCGDDAVKDTELANVCADSEHSEEPTATDARENAPTEQRDTDAAAKYILRFNEDRTLNLIHPLAIRLEDNTVIPLIAEGAVLSTGRVTPISPDGADSIGRCECTFMLGEEVLITCDISSLDFFAGLILESNEIMLVLYSDLEYRTNGSPIIKYKIGKDLIEMPKY